MAKGAAAAGGKGSPEAQLRAFVAKFDAKNRTLIRAVRKALRERFAGAFELVYDNYNFLVIGYSPSERPSDTIVSMAADANGVTLFFLWGVTLPDPKRVLQGSGKQVRRIRLPSVGVLARPEVKALLAAAVAQSRARFRASGRPMLMIRSVSAKQRPRRKPAGARPRRAPPKSVSARTGSGSPLDPASRRSG